MLTTTLSKTISVFSIAFALCACNNSSDAPKEEAKAADTVAATTAAAAPEKPAFTPFDAAEIVHNVKDYTKWRPFFDTDSVNRKAAGLETLVVGRGMENKNHVFIALSVADMQKAKDFSNSAKLKDVMKTAGVEGKPDVRFYHVIRFNPDSKEKQWVIVTHRVKDFDAWVKVFDGEGKEKRASEGLVDVVMSRGTDDPNVVQLVFDITDLAKAKAAILSDDKKKLMTSAGVEGKPDIQFYTTAE
jgi:hypothetical protein